MEASQNIHHGYQYSNGDNEAQGFIDGKADEREIRRFVSYTAEWSHVLNVLYLPAAGGAPCVSKTFAVDDASAIVSYIRKHNAEQKNIYWLPNFTKVSKKPAKTDMVAALFAWADCDPDIRRFGSYAAAREHLTGAHAETLKPLASLLIDSGNGLQAFFRLSEPLSLAQGFSDYEGVNEAVGAAFEGPSTFNVDRIMRFPGTVNWPTASKLAKGYPGAPGFARIVSISERVYTLDELRTLALAHGGARTASCASLVTLGEAASVDDLDEAINDARLAAREAANEMPARAARAVRGPDGEVDWAATFQDDLSADAKLRARVEGNTDGLNDKSGSGRDIAIYGMLVSRGYPHEAIVEVMHPLSGGSDPTRGDANPDSRYWERLRKNTRAMPKAYTDADAMLEEMNRKHAYVLVGSSGAVLKELHSTFDLIKVDAFKGFYANRMVEVEGKDKQGNPCTKWSPLAEVWMKWDRRRQYDGVEFAPEGARRGYFNMWRGFAVSPLPDAGVFASGLRCRRLLAHIKYNVCQGDRVRFRYFINWCADMVQNPGRKPGVAVSINGEKGTGKTKVIEALSALLGPHAQSISQSEQLLGRFNGHQAYALLIAAEESFWAGDKKAEGNLKHLVTSETLMMERKGIDAVSVRSLSRYIFVGNAEHIFPATADERRLFALTCGSDRRLDYTYFKAIDDQLYGAGKRSTQVSESAQGLRAFLSFLQSINLKGFEIRHIPETAALAQQRAHTLEPHDRFLRDCIAEKFIDGAAWTHGRRIVKLDFYDQYVKAAKASGCSHPINQSQFGKRIKDIFTWGTVQDSQDRRKWKISRWEDAKQAFEKFTKVRIEIDEAEEADTEEEPWADLV